MKYAICLSGQPRFFELCGARLTGLIEQNGLECDFFIHAWQTDSTYSGAAWSGEFEAENNLRERLIEMYQPKQILVDMEKDDLFKVQTSGLKKNTDAEPYIQASMFYSIHQASMLRRLYEQTTGEKYDVVVRTRFDYYLERFDGHLPGNVDDNTIYFPDVIRNKAVVCDYWMYANADTIACVENAYFPLFKKKQRFLDKSQKICGEEVITNAIDSAKLTRQPVDTLGGLMRDEKLENRKFGKWS